MCISVMPGLVYLYVKCNTGIQVSSLLLVGERLLYCSAVALMSCVTVAAQVT